MATVAWKILATGKLPTSETILLAPATDPVWVRLLNLVNTSATQKTVDIWVRMSGDVVSTLFTTVVLEADERCLLEQPLALGVGDELRGAVSSDASAIDYIFSGGESVP